MDEDIIGMLALFPTGNVPPAYLPCDGKTYPIRGNQVIFSVILTRFGGDGQTTFAVPDVPAPDGSVYAICQKGLYPVRP